MDSDCVIVGAGPGGLHTGTYMGRFNRRTVIFSGGKARAEWIPVTYNFPAMPQGITGMELILTMRRQAERFGVEIRKEIVDMVDGEDDHFVVKTNLSQVSTHKVILATGMEDIPPDIPNARHYVGRSIRHCPVCDAYESRGKRIVVFGTGDHVAAQSLWLAHYDSEITILTMGRGSRSDISDKYLRMLDERGIPIIEKKIAGIEERNHELGAVLFEDGTRLADVFRGYSAMGTSPNSRLPAKMGVAHDDQGYVTVDEHQQTSIKGVYAVGDIVSGSYAQVAVALGQAATAATHAHNSMLSF